jgi:nucleoside-diphosphate-sugar epimerase
MSNSTSFSFLVTGATGYIASWITRDLLAAGHTVYGTVRSLAKEDKYRHLLRAEQEHPGKLHLVEADLLDEGSFDAAAQSCDYVLHTASPFKIQVKNAKKDLVDPAVKGTKNVMRAALKSPRVRRVVLTSSVAAIYGDNIDIQDHETGKFGPEDWNTSSSLEHQAYSFSKTEAEKTARSMMKDQKEKDLITIHPGFVLGPSLAQRKDSTSIDFMLNLLTGQFKMGAPDLYFGFVDVRDISAMHIQAALMEGGSGQRFIGITESTNILGLAEKVEKSFPDVYPLPTRILPKLLLYITGPFMGLSWKFIRKNIGIAIAFDTTQTKRDLDFEFRPLLKTVRNQVEQMRSSGWID